MLSALDRYTSIIKSYRISRFERVDNALRIRIRIYLIDGSLLDIRETITTKFGRRYAYHWQDINGNLLMRWDNAPHWQNETFPHHKHVGDPARIETSFERTLDQIL